MAKDFMSVKDIMDSIGCGKSKAYRIINELNAELKKRGYKTISGRVSRKHFEDRTKTRNTVTD